MIYFSKCYNKKNLCNNKYYYLEMEYIYITYFLISDTINDLSKNTSSYTISHKVIKYGYV